MSKARYQTVAELAQALSGKTGKDNEETEIKNNCFYIMKALS